MATLLDVLFALVALWLYFFVPGYLLVKALWPEKRWKGPKAEMTAVEMVTAGFVSSLGLLLVIGFVLGNTNAFQASEADPLLEEVLAALSLAFLALGWFRGAYAREPPPAPSFVEPVSAGEEDLAPTFSRFESLLREEREAQRSLRQARREKAPSDEVRALEARVEEVRAKRRRAQQEREAAIHG